MKLLEKYNEATNEDDVKKVIFNIPLLKPVLAVFMVLTFVTPYLDWITPFYRSISDYTTYKILKRTPPGIVGHSYLSGEYMRAMQDSLSDSLSYRNGTGGPGDDWMDIVFFNYRNFLLKSLGYLDYQSPVLTELLSSKIDDLSELDQGNTFRQINNHFLGFFDRKDRSLSDLYQAAYYLEGAANFLAYAKDENLTENKDYNLSTFRQFVNDAFGYYERAKEKTKYWLPELHLTICRSVVTYDELRQDQNTLKEYLKVEDDKPSLEKQSANEFPTTAWLEPITCKGHNKSMQSTANAATD
jgi:hypothetical protein